MDERSFDQQREQAIYDLSHDPVVFLNAYRDSSEYKNCFASFKEGKKFIEDHPNEMRDVFENMETARESMINYSRDNHLSFKYDPSKYDPKNPIEEYLRLLADRKRHPDRFQSVGVDSLTHDRFRFAQHNEAALYLSKKYHLTEKMAEGMVTLMAIDRGLESYGVAVHNRIERIRHTMV